MRDPSSELDRRRPVWGALSGLFLDTELQPEDHRRIARVLSASGYTTPELEQILRREIGPVLSPNLRSPAGEWAGFDLARLEAEILRSKRRWWLSWLTEGLAMKMVRNDWERVRTLLTSESAT